MADIRRILCPTDFSEFSDIAFRYALSIAHHYRSKLLVEHVVESWQHPEAAFVPAHYYVEFRSHLLRKGQEELHRFVKNHANNEIRPEPVVDEGIAADSILALAEAQEVDLIVMGTHGRRGFDRLVLGSVTDRVMRSAPCPVLAASKPPHGSVAAGKERGHIHHLSRILFCADFSENSERALKYAISATAEYDAELTLLHVLEGVPSPAKTEEAMAVAAERLDKLIPPERRKTLKIKTAVRIGKPYEQIVQFAGDAQIDMVTMGVRGRGALDVAVFGSTTYRVMQLGSCPVLAVRS